MASDKEDRRQRRTRKILCDALLALLRDKDYAAITVKDIIDQADVARSTFYGHYTDKDDLLTGKHGVFAGHLNQPLPEPSRRTAVNHSPLSSRHWFHHLQAQRPILKIIANNSAMIVAMRNFSKMLHSDLKYQIQPYLSESPDNPIPSEVIVDYLTSTLMTLIKWWIEKDIAKTPEQMEEIFQALVIPGVASVSHAKHGM